MTIPEHINRLAKSEGFDRVEHVGSWNGFELYVADTDEACEIGLPQYILADGKAARWADVDETTDIMATLVD